MKRYNFIVLLICFLFLLMITNVNADTKCTDKEIAGLNKTAGLVKTNYEVEEKTKSLEGTAYEQNATTTVYSFNITIYNLTKDIYAVINNESNYQSINVDSTNIDNGKYTFTTDDFTNVIKYQIEIYSSLENCSGKKLRTFYFTKPKLNPYASYGICLENPNVSYCKKFITKDVNVTEEQLINAIEALQTTTKETSSKKSNNFITFIKNYYLYLIIGVVVLGGIITVIIKIYKKRTAL